MPMKGKQKMKKQPKQAVIARSADSEAVPSIENEPEDSSEIVNHQLFSSLPKKVRKLVYGQLDMRTAHSASLASSEIHEYFTEHPFKVDKIQFCLDGDSDDCQTVTIRYPTENYTESHCRAFEALPQQLTVSMENSVLQVHQARARRFRHMFAMHKMHLDPATVLHGLQMTETEDITVDKVKPRLDDLTEGQILQGIQAWIDFVRPTEQVILQVEDPSIAIPSGFFGLRGIKASKGLMTQVLNKHANEGDEKVARERPFVLVNVTLKQIRKLSATKLLLGLAPRISSDEVIQYFVEKVNEWVRNPFAYLHLCFARTPTDKAYAEDNIIRKLNMPRLSPRFNVHGAQNLRMKGAMTAAGIYGAGTIIQDMEYKRALCVINGPCVYTIDEEQCKEIDWSAPMPSPFELPQSLVDKNMQLDVDMTYTFKGKFLQHFVPGEVLREDCEFFERMLKSFCLHPLKRKGAKFGYGVFIRTLPHDGALTLEQLLGMIGELPEMKLNKWGEITDIMDQTFQMLSDLTTSDHVSRLVVKNAFNL